MELKLNKKNWLLMAVAKEEACEATQAAVEAVQRMQDSGGDTESMWALHDALAALPTGGIAAELVLMDQRKGWGADDARIYAIDAIVRLHMAFFGAQRGFDEARTLRQNLRAAAERRIDAGLALAFAPQAQSQAVEA